MEALLQARSRFAGTARARGLPAWTDCVVADLTSRIFDRRCCDDRAMAMDADRYQADQRCAAGDGARWSRATNAGACRAMGRTPRRTHCNGRTRNCSFLMGMCTALDAATDSSALVVPLRSVHADND